MGILFRKHSQFPRDMWNSEYRIIWRGGVIIYVGFLVESSDHSTFKLWWVFFFFSFIFNGFWSIFKKMIFYYHFTCFPFYLFSMSVRKDICSTCLILLPLTWLHRVLYSITLTLHQWCPFGGISGIHVVPNGFFWQGWTLFTLAHLWR